MNKKKENLNEKAKKKEKIWRVKKKSKKSEKKKKGEKIFLSKFFVLKIEKNLTKN